MSRSVPLAPVWLTLLLSLGCGCSQEATGDKPVGTRDIAKSDSTASDSTKLDLAKDEAEEKVVAYKPVHVPNLWTRKQGIDWPDFLGPNRDNISPEKGILTKWPEGGLRVVWHRKLGAGYPACTISRGRLFQFGAFDGVARLMALNAETGKELWKFEYKSGYEDLYQYDNGPRCCPVVDGDRVYLYGVGGMLYCLRVTDGQVIWKFDTIKKFGVVQNFFGVGSTPIIEGDLIITQVGGSPPGSPEKMTGEAVVKGAGSGIVAFDKFTGVVKYKITDELASYSSPVVATIDGRRWCFSYSRGGLVAFEPKSGKIDFQYPWRSKIFESVNASNPVVVGDKVFISETYSIGSSLLKVKPGGYDVVWKEGPKRREFIMKTHFNTAIHQEGYLYASSGRNTPDAKLRCIEMATGKIMWTVPRRRGLYRSSLLLVDGHFVCLSEDGVLSLFKVNPKKHEQVAIMVPQKNGEQLLRYPAWAAPVLSHGLLYVRGKDRLVCLELIPEPRK